MLDDGVKDKQTGLSYGFRGAHSPSLHREKRLVMNVVSNQYRKSDDVRG
jgi:hypothetical protein